MHCVASSTRRRSSRPLERDLPEREPARQILLERQLRSNLGLQAQLALGVARLLAGRGHEWIEGAALEVVDQVEGSPCVGRAGGVLEGEDTAQQPVAVAARLG